MLDERIKKLIKYYKRAQWVIIFLVMLPTILSIISGIVMLTLYENPKDIIFGVLIITFTSAIIFGGILALYMASKASVLAERQSVFIANISHELRSPLSIIKLYAQMLKSGYNEQYYKLCVEQILESGTKLENLVNQILLWKKLSHSNIVFHKEIIEDANKPLLEALKSFKLTHNLEKTKISVNLLQKSPTLIMDSYAVSRAIFNLLDNAYKYSEENKNISITTELSNIKNKTYFTYIISDKGIGITENEMEKIYDEFYRVNPTLQGFSGIGIGLSIVKSIVENHKGKIEIQSISGRGTTFKLLFPIKKHVKTKKKVTKSSKESNKVKNEK